MLGTAGLGFGGNPHPKVVTVPFCGGKQKVLVDRRLRTVLEQLMIKGFRDFLLKGDLITAAVGLVMALATFTLTEAFVDSLITPLIGAIIGEPHFDQLSFTINDSEFCLRRLHQRADRLRRHRGGGLLLRHPPVQALPGSERRLGEDAALPGMHDGDLDRGAALPEPAPRW